MIMSSKDLKLEYQGLAEWQIFLSAKTNFSGGDILTNFLGTNVKFWFLLYGAFQSLA